MPIYDRLCGQCGWEAIDVFEPVNHLAPLCPDCGEPTVRAWLTKASSVIGDEMDHTMVNGLKEPRRFRSKQEFARWKKDNNYTDRVRHIGQDGGDKSPFTRRWESMDAYTLEQARILVERTASEPARNEPKETPLKVRVTTGEVSSPEFAAFTGGRTFGR